MFGIIINKQGFKVEFVALNEDKTPQFYTLKDGEQIIETDWQIANSMNKPQWNGSEWIDTEPLPPQEEVPQEPSEMEKMADKISILKQEIATLKAENEDLKTRTTITEDAVLGLLIAGNSAI